MASELPLHPAHPTAIPIASSLPDQEGRRCRCGCVRRGVIAKDLVERRIRAELLGADPLMREYLWHRMWELDRVEEFPIYILGLVDVALWDLAGKAAGLSESE
jgi:hypothetical protein